MRAMMRPLLFVLLLALPWLAHAQETAFASRNTELKDQASADSRTVSDLREGTELKVTQRANGWAKVEAGGKSGWVRVFHLRFPVTAQASSSGGFLSGLSSAIGGRQTSKSSSIATTGIRGLSPEELKNANPDPAALRQMQSYRADKGSAERFAREGKLADARVDYEGGRR